MARYLHLLGEKRERFLASAKSETYTPATVLGDEKWRSASVCMTWPLLEEARVVIAEAADFDPLEIIDMQLTVSHAGDYFKPHYDNNYPETAERRITFVYYLGERETFTGGMLHFPEMAIGVEPSDDSLVFFNAGELHEITPVKQRAKAAPAARYTLNGWLR